MSVWTHVVGVIRVDSIRDEKNIEEVLGLMSDFYDYQEDCHLPKGSEGSLFYTVVKDTHPKRKESSKSILITGDLRDYEDLLEIKNWFKKTCSNLENKMFLIEATIFAYVENGDTLNLSRNIDGEWITYS